MSARVYIIAIKSQGCLQAGKCRLIDREEDAIVGDEWTISGTADELREAGNRRADIMIRGGNDAYGSKVGRNILDLIKVAVVSAARPS